MHAAFKTFATDTFAHASRADFVRGCKQLMKRAGVEIRKRRDRDDGS